MHRHPPVTLNAVTRYGYGLLIAAGGAFVALAVGARFGWLFWDHEVSEEVFEARTGWLDTLALRVSWMGSTPVVITVAAILAVVAWRRCPRLAVAIVLLALARPLVEFGLKELIHRDRPSGNQMVPGRGPAFPSGHPFAFALTWGLVPMVVALYTKRRAVWLMMAGTMWSLAVLVAASRVWLGVHWFSDVVAGLLLAVIGVSIAEAVAADRGCGCEAASRR
jgi:undecaprenyl-diphosphatase